MRKEWKKNITKQKVYTPLTHMSLDYFRRVPEERREREKRHNVGNF